MDAAVIPPYVAGPLRLAPFTALRLASSRISDPASARAFARPYRDVSARLAQWEERGLAVHDERPALYLHEYTVDGTVVRGLVGALDVSRRAARPEDRAVLPHEGIYPAHADDLADRMLEMGLNPAPILLVHHAPPRLREETAAVLARLPDHQFLDRSGHAHRLWVLADADEQDRLNAGLAEARALIADGHHRYAAYMRLQQRSPGTSVDRGLAMLVDQDDTPLSLGAIHRVLQGSSAHDVEVAALSLGLGVAPVDPLAVHEPREDSLVVTDRELGISVTFPRLGRRSPVEALHDELVPALPRGPHRIAYHHSAEAALDHAGPHVGTAVFVPAVSLDHALEVALEGRLLPEKATSFQPKPPFGVLLRSLHDE